MMRRLAAVLLAFMALGTPFARAIEEGRPVPQGFVLAQGWIITLYLDRPTSDNRMEYELSGVYPERERCKEIIRSMRIMVKGARLRCDRIDEFRPSQIVEFP